MKRPLREIGAENIKYFRTKKGLTQLELATELGKSANYINGIENGVSFPSIDMMEKIAEALSIEPHELLMERGCPQNVFQFNADAFSNEIAESLYERLKKDIALEVRDVITKRRKK